MQSLRKARLLSALAITAWISVWLSGCLVNLFDAWRGGPQVLPLRQLARLSLPAPLGEPMADGQGGFCIQAADGRVSRLGPDGRPIWRIDTPSHFSLLSVQPGEGVTVLAGRWGEALAIADDGSEAWRFLPVHHELDRARPQGGGEARFYTMATALVYGLDENGSLQWMMRIPSATTANSQHPWMWLDPGGELQTRCNYGRVRVDRSGEGSLLDNDLRCDARVLDISDDGRVLTLGAGLLVSSTDGESLGMAGRAGEAVDAGVQAWLTQAGSATLDSMEYARFDAAGQELRAEALPGQPLAACRLEDEQVYLCGTTGSMRELQQFPMVLAALLGSSRHPEVLEESVPLVASGRRLMLATAELSIPIRVPSWLRNGDWSISSQDGRQLLFMNQAGEIRICAISEAAQ